MTENAPRSADYAAAFANDNGLMFWPPECDLTGWFGAPAVAQAWEKWSDPAERRRIRDRQQTLTCRTWMASRSRAGVSPWCGAKGIGTAWAKAHAAEAHPGEAAEFFHTYARWTYEMMGFADLWDGKPRGWYNLLDGRDPSVKQWEADALELGTAAADYWWQEPQHFDGSRATDQACPDCGHHLSLHDTDGSGISTCDCRKSPPKDADGT